MLTTLLPTLFFLISASPLLIGNSGRLIPSSISVLPWVCQVLLFRVAHLDDVVDEYENVSSPVSGAISFVLSLASVRTKIAFLPMLNLVNNVLRS